MESVTTPAITHTASYPDATESDDSEYEYEYNESESETFYLNLDLTSCNGPIRAPRRRSATSSTTSSTPIQVPLSTMGSPGSSMHSEGQQVIDVDPGLDMQDRVQIMDLHSRNPIVSYQNQIFSCSWADLIGTELLFSLPGERSDLPLLRQDKDFDLISASRVKILGQKANLISSSGSKTSLFRKEPFSSTSVPQKSGPVTNQARFLERLMNAKKARDEQDIVRTVFPQKRSQNLESRLQGWARTEGRIAEFEELNRRVLEGDVTAVIALEKIYARMEGSPLEDRPSPLIPVEAHNPTASQVTPAHPGSSRATTEAVGQNGAPTNTDDGQG